ncbi:MAG: PAS domain-containing sensor histidine kinase [Deltaproteobacteria bacterium]|nr:PAS domain-containing sensor histidine kinase [Deltaproteobacteria bacterium]
MVEREGSLSLSVDGRILRLGPAFEALLGCSDQEARGRDFTFLFPAGSEEEHRGLLKTARASGTVSAFKTRMIKSDGAPLDVYISIYSLKDRLGDINSFMLTVSLDKSAGVPAILTDEFQRIFRFSNDGVAVTDKWGFIIDVNQAWLDTYGYKKDECLGKNPRILKSPHSKKELYEKMWADILDPAKGFWRGEIINLNKDGVEVPVLLSINAVKDESGEIRNFLGIAFNMTRQKELDSINKMYIDYIIHDIRGPLTAIMANTELLEMQLEGAVTEPVKKKIDTIFSAAQKISGMTSDMLDFSRAKSGCLTIKKENIQFASALKEAVRPFESAEKKLFVNGIPYDENAIGRAMIKADPDKLQRIIYNLLSNAFKHAASSVHARWEINADSLKFSVSDDGSGISPENAERIFDAFYQTREGVKTGGAGLGLSIVKNFVQVHGGKVWVEHEKEAGATIAFTIPV